MSITKENSLQSQINYLKRRINCLCNSILGLDSGGEGYLVYTALLTQSGTSAPVATVLENTLGGTVVWGYVSAGNYTATLANAFTSGKTAVFLSGNGGIVGSNIDSASQITIYSLNSAGDGEDEYIQTAPIEIRVYP